MAATDPGNIFTTTAADLIAAQQAARRRQQQELLKQIMSGAPKAGPVAQGAAQAGVALGSGIGEGIAKRLFGASPEEVEIERRKKIDETMQGFEAEWEDDPEMSGPENMAARSKALRSRLNPYLNASERLQLAATQYAYTNEAFEQGRLREQDKREAQKAADDHLSSKIDLQIAQLQKDAAERRAKYGDASEIQVFKTADGEQVYANTDSPNAVQLFDAANDPESGVSYLGTTDQLAAQKLQAMKPSKGNSLKYTASQLSDMVNLNEAARTVNALQSPEMQKAIGDFRSLQVLFDEAWESASPMIPDKIKKALGIPMSTKGKTTDAQTALANLSIAIQSVIKGVPSNYDQYLIELTKADRWNTGPDVANSRIAWMKDVITASLRAQIAYHNENADVDQPLPAALRLAAKNVGIDIASVGTYEEEAASAYQRKQRAVEQERRNGSLTDKDIKRISGSGGAAPVGTPAAAPEEETLDF